MAGNWYFTQGYGFQTDVDEVGVSQVVYRVNHSVDMAINRHVEVFFRSVRKKKKTGIYLEPKFLIVFTVP